MDLYIVHSFGQKGKLKMMVLLLFMVGSAATFQKWGKSCGPAKKLDETSRASMIVLRYSLGQTCFHKITVPANARFMIIPQGTPYADPEAFMQADTERRFLLEYATKHGSSETLYSGTILRNKFDDIDPVPWSSDLKVTLYGDGDKEFFLNVYRVPDRIRYFDCGKTSISNSIIGGGEAGPYSIPWQVGLTIGEERRPFCDGTLISPYHVLTAAHCLWQKSNIIVLIREHNVTDVKYGDRHDVKCSKIHPHYDARQRILDIAVLTLKTPATITGDSLARAACLPHDYEKKYGGQQLTLSGWGLLFWNVKSCSHSPNVLQHVGVLGISNADCEKVYKIKGMEYIMLCTRKVTSGGIHVCNAASGGPLTSIEAGKTTVVGVVSWGQSCGHEDRPAVYARVIIALKWLMLEQGVYDRTGRCTW